jgi:hypothetical protein
MPNFRCEQIPISLYSPVRAADRVVAGVDGTVIDLFMFVYQGQVDVLGTETGGQTRFFFLFFRSYR